MLMPSLDTSIANAALPSLTRAFGAPFESVRWVVLAYLLTLTAFSVLAGRLGDRFGRSRALLVATMVFLFSSAACSLAPTLSVLLTARAAQGLGAAAITALALALVHEIVPPSARGRAIGLLGTMSAVGTTIGPSLGGLLTAAFGWPAIFLVNVPIGVTALLIGFRHLPGHSAAAVPPRGFDTSVLRTPDALAGLAASALVSTVMMTTLVVGPFHLSRSMGLSDGALGLALSLGPLVAALCGIPAGRLIDRFGAQRTTVAGLLVMATAASAAGLLPLSAGVPAYLCAIGGMTAAYAVFQAANTTHFLTTIDPGVRGAAAGMLGLTRNLGLIAGASAMGGVFAWAVGPIGVATAPPDAVAAGVRITFRIAALLIGVALAAVVFGRADRRSTLNHSPAVTHSEGR
jgi:MFS family permease